MRRALVENLYVEAMVLADEAHAAFAGDRDHGRGDADGLTLVSLACESLKTTTRLMHIVAWLLHHRAMMAGEPGAGPGDRAADIGEPIAADWMVCLHFDTTRRRIVAASERLFDRIAALQENCQAERAPMPVQQLLARLEASF
jgi:regulator of CtrA degradation